MPKYVDGYVLPLQKKHLRTYRAIAQRAGKIWKEHGALEYRECVGEDMTATFCQPFTRQLKTKPGETVIKQVLDTTLGPLPGGPGG